MLQTAAPLVGGCGVVAVTTLLFLALRTGKGKVLAPATFRIGVTTLLSMSFLVYPSVSLGLFRYFKCVDTGTDRVLLADMRISCSGSHYMSSLAYVLVMLIIYPLGIPGSYALLLRLKHKNLVVENEDVRNANESIAHLKFLWGSYESRYYWWEVVEMARRL